MANVTITGLTTNASPASTDVYPQDTSGGTTGKVTADVLVKSSATLNASQWTVSLAVAAEAGHKRVVTATLKDFNNATLASAKVLAFALASAATAYAVSDEGSGTGLTTGANNVSQFTTAATGVAEIGFTDANAETLKVVFFTPQGPVVASLTFAG